ncbi:MAG TPA: hypothetical protein VI039_12975 [Solirubrobacterales bacterium]
MKDSTQFGVHNVEGTAVVTGLSETPIEIRPGERVILTAEHSLGAGEVVPGVLDASCLQESAAE